MTSENIDPFSNDLNGRVSGEIGDLIGNINSQIQRTVEEAICNQVLPQVQNVLRVVQGGNAFSPKD